MITAELSPGSYVPVSLVQWTPSGHVQVKHTIVIGRVWPAMIGVFRPVPVMKLIHSDGRKALAAELARLPHSPDPAGSIDPQLSRGGRP